MLRNTSSSMPISLTLPRHPIHPLLTQLRQPVRFAPRRLIRDTIVPPAAHHTDAPRSRQSALESLFGCSVHVHRIAHTVCSH